MQQEPSGSSVDILHVLKCVWRRAWIVVLAAVIVAVAAFCYATVVLKPQYSSSVMLYVNNGSISLGGASISLSSSQLTAAQSLVKTYSYILKNRTTLEMVIEEASLTYTYEQLTGMISASSVGGTEILGITVTCEDPYMAAYIANTIAKILPVRISEIIEGASMEVIDHAVPKLTKVSPNITQYTVLGMMVGALIAAAVIAVIAIMDDTIHDEEHILQEYGFPILAKVPDLFDDSSHRYGYRKRYGYYYHSYRTYGNNNDRKKAGKQ